MASNDKETKRNFRQDLAKEILELIKAEKAPWQKPWDPQSSQLALGLPQNATTGHAYRGGNTMWLMAQANKQGYEDPRWCTYKQAQEKGWQVKKGEKSTTIEYWQWEKEEERKNAQGQKETVRIKLDPPRVFYANVFNAKQIDGIPAYEPKLTPEWETVAGAEKILKASGATILHDQGDRAFYSLSSDAIHLPSKAGFARELDYYEVALHELAHWTGHADRLNRDLSGSFGSENYAKEELRAQMTSLYLAAELGVPFNPERHAAYQASWMKVLKQDINEFFRASRDAEQIADHILGLGKELSLSQAEYPDKTPEVSSNVSIINPRVLVHTFDVSEQQQEKRQLNAVEQDATKSRPETEQRQDFHKARQIILKDFGKNVKVYDANVEKGDYRGQVITVTDQYVGQRVGANTFILHDRNQLSGDFYKGKSAHIQYQNQKGNSIITEREKTNEQGISR